MKLRMVTVIRPDFQNRDRYGNTITPTLADYHDVPRVSTFGTWRAVDLLPMDTLAALSRLRYQLIGVRTRKAK